MAKTSCKHASESWKDWSTGTTLTHRETTFLPNLKVITFESTSLDDGAKSRIFPFVYQCTDFTAYNEKSRKFSVIIVDVDLDECTEQIATVLRIGVPFVLHLLSEEKFWNVYHKDSYHKPTLTSIVRRQF